MPSRRDRLPAGTRSASNRAAQKVFENELALARLQGAEDVRRRVREVLTSSAISVEVDGTSVEVVTAAAIEEALG